MKLDVHIDGGSRGNPGPAATGVMIRDAGSGRVLHAGGYFLGKATNNEAEYRGLLKALEIVAGLGPDQVRIHSDSELLVKQITGEYRVKSASLRPLVEEAQGRLLTLNQWQLTHVRREQNHDADRLVNDALDRRRDVVETGAGAEAGEAPAPIAGSEHGWFTATIERDPGPHCPAATPAGKPFEFGPNVPAGVCLYAAEAALGAGPRHWKPGQHEAVTRCPRCDAPIRLELDDEV